MDNQTNSGKKKATPIACVYNREKKTYLFISNKFDYLFVTKKSHCERIRIEKTWLMRDRSFRIFLNANGYKEVLFSARSFTDLMLANEEKLRFEPVPPSQELYKKIGIPTDYLNTLDLSKIPKTRLEAQAALEATISITAGIFQILKAEEKKYVSKPFIAEETSRSKKCCIL